MRYVNEFEKHLNRNVGNPSFLVMSPRTGLYQSVYLRVRGSGHV